jgi:hypothetical protein
MEKYFGDFGRATIIELLQPWKSFDKASPLLWTFLAAMLMLFIGVNLPFFDILIWIGGFLVAFFAAVAISLFCDL